MDDVSGRSRWTSPKTRDLVLKPLSQSALRKSDEPLVTRAQRIEEFELTLAKQEFVIPLHMEQRRRRDSSCVALEALGQIEPLEMHVGYLQAKLCEDCAPEMLSDTNADRNHKTCPHQQSQVAENLRVHWPGNLQALDHHSRVRDHSISHDRDADFTRCPAQPQRFSHGTNW